jgi:hypothetical protein
MGHGDVIRVCEDAIWRPAAPDVDDGGGPFAGVNTRRCACGNHDVDCRAGRVRQQIAVPRAIRRRNIVDALDGERQRTRIAGLARRLPRLDPAVNPRPVFRYLHLVTCVGSG